MVEFCYDQTDHQTFDGTLIPMVYLKLPEKISAFAEVLDMTAAEVGKVVALVEAPGKFAVLVEALGRVAVLV